MRKLTFLTALAASLSFASFGDELTGYISDSRCGAKHDTVSEANTKCVNGCLKGGADPVLVSNGKVYKINDDSRDKAVAHAGQNVTVDGTVSGDTVSIKSIEAAK
jgi:predicted acyltransferase (DUF342 family)